MATIKGSCDNSRYILTCDYTYTQNVSANTSTITAKVYLDGNGYTTSSSYWNCVINGTTVTSNKSADIGSKTLLGSRTWTVNHNSDGTCKTTISFSYSNGLSSSGTYTTKTGSGSATVTLPTIARGSTISLNKTSATLGSDSVTVNISRASSSYTHKVQLYFGSYNALLAENVATSYTFTPAVSLSSQIPNATSGTATIKVQTMNGSTWIAETSKTITFNVPSSAVPTIGSIGITGNNLLGSVYVAGKSTVTAKINNAAGVYSSTIKSYSISGAGISSSSSSATSGALSAGTHTITGKVTDSRGRTASKTASITVHSYYSPSVSIKAYRCDSSGTKSDSGTYAKVDITPDIVNVGNANVNAKQYQVETKKASESSWTVKKSWTTLSSYNSTITYDLGSGWDNTVTYNIRVSIKDSYNTVATTATIGTISCIMNIEQKGIGIGKPYEQGGLDVKGAIYSDAVKVLTENHPVSGNWWKGVPKVNTDGVMEVGKYIDFHNSNSTTADYDIRLSVQSDNLESSGGLKAQGNVSAVGSLWAGGARVGVVASHGGLDIGEASRTTTICSKTAPSWWDGSTNRTLLHNSGHLYMNSGYNIITSSASYYANQDGDSTGSGFVARRYLDNKQQSAKLMVINSGGGVAGMIHRNETGGYESQVLLQTWASGGSGCFRPGVTGVCENGTSAYKWKFVCANNGTIQTSDERFKVKRGFANIDDCFEMVKNTELYKYIMLDKNKEDVSRNKLGKLAMECNNDEAKVHMGIMAQDIQKYECGKHILIEGEYEKEDGTTDTMLHINPLDMTMAVMGALQQEIAKREELEEKVKSLEERLNKLESLLSNTIAQ